MSLAIIDSSGLQRAIGKLFKMPRALRLFLAETIQMQMDALTLMREQIAESTASINLSGAGEVTVHTCTDYTREYLSDLSVPATTGNKTGMYIYVKGIGYYITLSATPTAAVEVDLQGIFLEQGDYITIVGTGNGADNSKTVRLLFQRINLAR